MAEVISIAPSTSSITSLSDRDHFLSVYRWMVLGRTVEDKVASLYRSGKIVGGVYLGKGQEAFSCALACELREGDIFSPLIRDLSVRMDFGDTPLESMRTYLGRVTGPMRGRDGNIHTGQPLKGRPAMISHLGAMVSVVNGMLMGRRFKGTLEAALFADNMPPAVYRTLIEQTRAGLPT